ncbi:MerR family transcriptional regulator [Herpetosiphon giganteus]|uniref:MerR family transcriptional regulator n=1 Tax=Herpetosiphon giganteus TaxID=2029754 RepID=UPI00195DE028|nr:MerR family transcriptional regulator [Herpetosiphon giganteus]MBM7844588.1 DNA-binding transcriptional MerR regulator [Herpetosiphon giganteus]
MKVERYFRTVDLARAINISVQQVRNYEAEGFLPAVERGPNGYRRYTQQHIDALNTAQSMINGYGWRAAQTIMAALHQTDHQTAFNLINQHHAKLDNIRQQLDQTLSLLKAVADQLPPSQRQQQRLLVGEAAKAVGVPISALRFWEQQGLLQPIRQQSNKYRYYDERQLRRLRIIVLLRQANADFGSIRTTLATLDQQQPQRAVAAIEHRRAALAQQSWECLQANTSLVSYIKTYLPLAPLPII